MDKMVQKCPNIAESRKSLTNTRIRKYCVKNIALAEIRQVTGHKNMNSINNYSEKTLHKQKKMSEILFTEITKDNSTYCA